MSHDYEPNREVNYLNKLDQQVRIDAAAWDRAMFEFEHIERQPILYYTLEILPNGEIGSNGKSLIEMTDTSMPGGRESVESIREISKMFALDSAIRTAVFHSPDIGYDRDYLYVFEKNLDGKINARAIEYKGNAESRNNLQQLIVDTAGDATVRTGNMYQPIFSEDVLPTKQIAFIAEQSYQNQALREQYAEYRGRLVATVIHEELTQARQLDRIRRIVSELEHKVQSAFLSKDRSTHIYEEVYRWALEDARSPGSDFVRTGNTTQSFSSIAERSIPRIINQPKHTPLSSKVVRENPQIAYEIRQIDEYVKIQQQETNVVPIQGIRSSRLDFSVLDRFILINANSGGLLTDSLTQPTGTMNLLEQFMSRATFVQLDAYTSTGESRGTETVVTDATENNNQEIQELDVPVDFKRTASIIDVLKETEDPLLSQPVVDGVQIKELPSSNLLSEEPVFSQTTIGNSEVRAVFLLEMLGFGDFVRTSETVLDQELFLAVKQDLSKVSGGSADQNVISYILSAIRSVPVLMLERSGEIRSLNDETDVALGVVPESIIKNFLTSFFKEKLNINERSYLWLESIIMDYEHKGEIPLLTAMLSYFNENREIFKQIGDVDFYLHFIPQEGRSKKNMLPLFLLLQVYKEIVILMKTKNIHRMYLVNLRKNTFQSILKKMEELVQKELVDNYSSQFLLKLKSSFVPLKDGLLYEYNGNTDYANL